MYRTLSELRDTINQLIESQGEDAGCAAFVFTQNDVFEHNEEMTQEENEIMDVFDDELFWKSHVWRSSNGLRHIPKRVCDLPGFNYEVVLRNMFVSRFAKSQSKSTVAKSPAKRA